MQRTDSLYINSFKKSTFFSKTSQSVYGDGHYLKKLQSGNFIVEDSSAIQSHFILNSTKISTVTVSVQTHEILNTTLGVIPEPEFLYFTKEKFLENLKQQNIRDA